MLKKVFALAALTLPLSVHAIIEDFGDYTRDTETGLDWLDLTITRGQSTGYVRSQLGVGGIYEGWQYATSADVALLFAHFESSPNPYCGGAIGDCNDGNTNESLLIEYMIHTLGDTLDAHLDDIGSGNDVAVGGAGAARGYVSDSPRTTSTNITGYAWVSDYELVRRISRNQYLNGPDSYSADAGYANTRFISDPEWGSFLIKSYNAAVIPVPAAAWLFGSALMGLVGLNRSR